LKSKGTEVGRERRWIAKRGREEIKREKGYRKRKQKKTIRIFREDWA
jgi:hypothetical protein